MPSPLINDLSQIPNIVGSLGLAIAEAQKHFDANYLNGIHTLAAIAKSILGNAPPEGTRDFLEKLIETAAPTRYQFTETTLAVKLDLSESRNWSAKAGVAFGFAGAVVNASFAYGFASSYRAGAEIKTTLHAVLPQNNAEAFKLLLAQADKLQPPALPAVAPLNQQVIDAMNSAAQSVGVKPTAITTAAPPAGGAGGGGGQ